MYHVVTRRGSVPTDHQTSLQLEAPITPAELSAVIKDRPKGKSSDPDSFTNAYYCKFHMLLSSWTCAYFNALASGIGAPKEVLLAHITVIP